MTETAGTPVAIARARNGDLAVFAANGLLLASWLARLPDVQERLHLSPAELGIMLLALSVGALTGLPVAGRLLHRWGSIRVTRIGALLALPGLVLAATAVTVGSALPLVMAGLFLVGFGSALWDVAQNLEGSVIEQALRRSIMPWFHAAFSAGTVVAALVAVAFIALGIPLIVHLVLVAVVCAAGVGWGTRRFLPATDHAGSGPPEPRRSAWREPRTVLIGVMVFAAAFTEGSANDWLAVAMVDGHHTSQALGALGLATFLTAMTAGRILGTRALDRYGRVTVLRALFACALAGSALVVFGATPLAFAGAAIWGVGASLGFPVGMSAASDDPARAAARLSVVATIGYGAFLAGPPLLGFLGNEVGILRALMVVGLVSVLALLVVPAARPLDPTRR